MKNHKKTHPPITNPMSRYPKYSGSRSSWGVANVPSVIVEIEDDGKGIDSKVIFDSAVRKGFIDENDDLTDDEIF